VALLPDTELSLISLNCGAVVLWTADAEAYRDTYDDWVSGGQSCHAGPASQSRGARLNHVPLMLMELAAAGEITERKDCRGYLGAQCLDS
jgi:hypothetical protein